MSCKKDNLKKLSKSEVSNVSGGEKWYILDETDYSDDENDASLMARVTLGIYDNANKRVGEANDLDRAIEFAKEHSLGNLDILKCDDCINEFFYD